MRRVVLVVAMFAALLSAQPGGTAHAQTADGDVAPVTGDAQPTPRDAGRAEEAGRQAGPVGGGARPSTPGEGPGTSPSPAPPGAGASNPAGVATYRVFATQYNPNTAGSVEVAVPDKCAKFAALRNQGILNQFGCPAGYRLDLDYRVVVTRDNGSTSTIPVKDVGPWNQDDNYWAAPGSPRPRRLFTDVPRGTPEAQAAFYNGYNTVADCKSLSHEPTGRSGAADQFGRCVLNPAGIDLSVEAAKQLGLGNLENAWVTVSFLWEPSDGSGTGATYQPLNPSRILDTRDGTGTGGATSPLGQASALELQVTGAGGVPTAGVTAVALNVTATGASGPDSFLTVFPAGTSRPLASNLNFVPGKAIPNLVIARIGSGGKVAVYNNIGSVHVVADVQGYFTDSRTSASTYVPLNPVRILDTRTGTGATQAKVPAGGSIELTVTGGNGVPAGARAVALNLTTTEATGPESFLTLYPSGQSRPLVSNLNFTSGPPSTNAVIARVGDNGKVRVYNNLGSTDVVADLNGWFAAPVASGIPPGQVYYPINPVRALDTRNGSGPIGPGGTVDLAVAGVGGVPMGATAVVLNVTATNSPGPDSFLTLYPAGTTRPLASNLNFVAGQTVPNLVMVRLNNGRVSIYNNLGSVGVVADIQGWYAA